MSMQPEEYWQEFLLAGEIGVMPDGYSFAAGLPNGRRLALPIRTLTDGSGLASLIINQASFEVQTNLTGLLTAALKGVEADIVVGLPTLGLTVASAVAQHLGHGRYVALGTSRKFWYDDALSAPLSSVTTPDAKRLYIDPRLLPLLDGRRVVLIDDVLSSGRSINAGLALLGALGIKPVAIGAIMLQTRRWESALGADSPPVIGAFETPRLMWIGGSWRET